MERKARVLLGGGWQVCVPGPLGGKMTPTASARGLCGLGAPCVLGVVVGPGHGTSLPAPVLLSPGQGEAAHQTTFLNIWKERSLSRDPGPTAGNSDLSTFGILGGS